MRRIDAPESLGTVASYGHAVSEQVLCVTVLNHVFVAMVRDPVTGEHGGGEAGNEDRSTRSGS